MPHYERTDIVNGKPVSTRCDIELFAVRTLVRPNGTIITWHLYRDTMRRRVSRPDTGALYINGKPWWNAEIHTMKAMEPSGAVLHDTGWIRVYPGKATGKHNSHSRDSFSDWAREMDWRY
jgi:hypothetical protein